MNNQIEILNNSIDHSTSEQLDDNNQEIQDNVSKSDHTNNLDNISTSSSPNLNEKEEQINNKLNITNPKQLGSNDSILSSSSGSSVSLSPKTQQNPKYAPEIFKQYEDSLKLFNHHRFAGLHNFMKPMPNQHHQSSPISTHTTNTPTSCLSDSSLLMERFYHQNSQQNTPFTNPTDKLLAQQAILAQYAQFYNPNNLAVAAMQAHNDIFEREKERYLSSLNFGFGQNQAQFGQNNNRLNIESPRTPVVNNILNQSNQINNTNQKENRERRRGNSSGNSRSPSPTSSQHSGQIDCEEDEDNLADDSQSINAANGEWTYEEQFKQLYELSDDVKRKEFLDDLFSFMQKRGSPVNRIPIMAKHVLDLYELYRLVVSKGGLVEVINKKLWREITKGLNLPSSITSAAFTLRTQYMKYLYPYECEKLKMSTPSELQAAIDGNRREGRRPVYGYEYASPNGMNGSSVNHNLPPQNNIVPQPNPSLNMPSSLPHPMHHPNLHPIHHNHPAHPLMPHLHQSPSHAAILAAAAAAVVAQQHHNLYDAANNINNNINNNNINNNSNQENHLHSTQNSILPAFSKPYREMNTPPSSASSNPSSNETTPLVNLNANHNENETSFNQSSARLAIKRPFETLDQNKCDSLKESVNKKLSLDQSINSNNCNKNENVNLNVGKNGNNNNNKMNIKIFSKESAEMLNLDKSLSISLEFNGLIYQGTLYASRLDNNSGIQIQIPIGSNTESAFSKKTLDTSSSNTNTTNTNIKTDLVY